MKRSSTSSQGAGVRTARRARGLTTGAVFMVGIAVAVLSGCSAQNEPAVYPDVEWQGSAPSGPLEQDPWVQGVRAALEAEAVARNRNDFSLSEFKQSATDSYIDRQMGSAIEALASHHRTYLLPGPTPFLPTEVEVGAWGKGDDYAHVRGCYAMEWATESGTPPKDLVAHGREYRVERDSSGVIRVDSIASLPDLDCEAVGSLPVALFDPAPEPSGVTEAYDVVRTDGTTSRTR